MLHIKKLKYASEKHDAYFIRPGDGRSSPDENYGPVRPGAPCYFIHGTQWENLPSILSFGFSCRSDDTSKKRGR
eukprot:2664619-Pyramimonas_sp.AAC.1